MLEKITRHNRLTFIHKFLVIALLFIGFITMINPKGYHVQLNEDTWKGFPYLEKGDYLLHVYFNDEVSSNNELVVYTNDYIDENNQTGIELLKVNIDQNIKNGKLETILSLDCDVYNATLKTTADNDSINYINKVDIQAGQLQNFDHYVIGFLCILGSIIIFILGAYVPFEKYRDIIILLGIGIFSCLPIFSDFLISGDDLGYHVGRIDAIYRGLKAGEFPVYIGSSQMGGFGTLSGIMYPQFFLYPFAILRFFNVSLMLCYKLFIVCINIGSAFTAYFCAKSISGSNKIGYWTSILYTLSAYRLCNIYLRAALGETLAMVFFPLIIWGVYEVFWGNHKKWYILVIGMSGLIQSHVNSVIICAFFLIIELFIWLIKKDKSDILKRFLSGIKAAFITILINLFFIVPFLFYCNEDLQCFNMPNRLSDTALYFSQMFSIFPIAQGTDVSLGCTINEMPHTIGFVLLIGSICMFIVANIDKDNPIIKIGKRCLVYGLLALFMTSWLFPWDKIQNIEVFRDIVTSIQFAWRLMGPASIFLSIAAAIGIVYIANLFKNVRVIIYTICIIFTVCTASYMFDIKGYIPTQYVDKMTFDGYGYTDAMYMYHDGESFKPHNLKYSRSEAFITTKNNSTVKYSKYNRNGMYLSVVINNINNIENDYLLFPFYYYPGYKVLVDGISVENYNIDDKVACELPSGTNKIEVYYNGFVGFTIANIISLLTLLIILLNWIYSYISNKRKCLKIK